MTPSGGARPPAARRARRSCPASVALPYAVGLLGWHLARFTPVGTWWPFELFDVFGTWLYLPLLPLALGALILRSREAAIWLAVPLILFGSEYGALFVPQRPPDGRTALRVMTANLRIDNDDALGFGGVLAQHEPDVVAVQELRETMAARLADVLRERYPHQALHPSRGSFGMGVFSRHPIRMDAPVGRCSDVCFAREVRLELDGRSATLINVHPRPPRIRAAHLGPLPLPTSFQNDEPTRVVGAVLERVETIPEPVVVLGDLNIGDRQPFYRLMRRRLLDAHREAGWGFGHTFPNMAFAGLPTPPLVRIDYVLHDDSWATRSTRTGNLAGSDHRYVVAELVLR